MGNSVNGMAVRELSKEVMDICLSDAELASENRRFSRSGGVSENNRGAGFVPAYRDDRTGAIALSKSADGSPAPIHVLDGLPEAWIATRDATGKATSLVCGIVSGFYRDGQFFTREEAAAQLELPEG